MHVRTGFDPVPYTGLGIDVFDLRTWPGFQQAWDYLKSKLEEFYTLPARIGAIKRRATTLLGVAQRKGAATAAGEVADILESVPEVERRHQATAAKVSEAMSATQEAGLGAVPWLLISAIMTAAGGIKWLLDKVKHDERKLDMIEQGLLTPDEAAALEGNGLLPKWTGQLGKYAVPIGLAAAAWFMLSKGRRR